MSDTLAPGPYKQLPLGNGQSASLYLIDFDKAGRPEGPLTRQHLLSTASQVNFTDIYLLSHGWNNVFKDALAFYERLLTGYLTERQALGLNVTEKYRPLYVGNIWPSTALALPWEEGPDFAAAGAADSTEHAEQFRIERRELTQRLKDSDSFTPSLDASRVFAIRTSSGRGIEVSVGFIKLVSMLGDTEVFLDLPDAVQKGGDYVAHITNTIENTAAQQNGKKLEVARSYPSFLGLSPTDEKTLNESNVVQNKREFVQEQGLAFILAHELAHHFLNHIEGTRSIEEKRMNESAADDFALRLISKSGYQPFFAKWQFVYFIQLEENTQIAPNSEDYPAPACRALPLVQAGIADMRADHGFMSSLKKEGTFKLWNRNMGVLQAGFSKNCQ